MLRAPWLIVFVAALTFSAIEAARADGLLQFEGSQLKWGQLDSQSTTVITYALLKGTYTVPKDKSILSPDNCGIMEPFSEISAASPGVSTELVKHQLEAALANWEGVAGVKFVETANARDANIVIGATSGQNGKAFANLQYRGSQPAEPIMKALGKASTEHQGEVSSPVKYGAVLAIKQAYVCLNSKSRWKVGFDGDLDVYDLRYTFAHEIGHTIGLDHPGRSGSVMAYRYDEHVEQLQPSDIATVQILYGPKRSNH